MLILVSIGRELSRYSHLSLISLIGKIERLIRLYREHPHHSQDLHLKCLSTSVPNPRNIVSDTRLPPLVRTLQLGLLIGLLPLRIRLSRPTSPDFTSLSTPPETVGLGLSMNRDLGLTG